MKKIILRKYPGKEFPDSLECLEIQDLKLTQNEGYLMETVFVSVDPVMRVWLSGART